MDRTNIVFKFSCRALNDTAHRCSIWLQVSKNIAFSQAEKVKKTVDNGSNMLSLFNYCCIKCEFSTESLLIKAIENI